MTTRTPIAYATSRTPTNWSGNIENALATINQNSTESQAELLEIQALLGVSWINADATPTKRGNYVVTGSDLLVPVDASQGSFTVLLRKVSSIPNTALSIKRIDSHKQNAVVVNASIDETIDGLQSMRVGPNGTLWLFPDPYNPHNWLSLQD